MVEVDERGIDRNSATTTAGVRARVSPGRSGLREVNYRYRRMPAGV